jgi:uncharacterized caspase-like protein
MRTLRLALAFVLVLLLPAGVAGAEGRIALVIGNSAYEAISPLRNPRNDAELMAETLRDVGFEVVVALDVDRRGMARAVRDFGTQLRELGTDAVGLFYYAGHGVQYRGDNYLIPVGAQVDSSADLVIEALRVADILGQMQEAQNALNLVVLDACRNNPFPQATRSVDRGLARQSALNGSIMAFSAAPGETAVDGEGKNSPYTLALSQSIRTPGLTVEQVFKRTRVSVLGATDGRQTPWEESSLIDDFFFIEQQAEQETETSESGLSEENALEVAFWNGTVVLDNIVAYQEYLEAYPEGTFASLAQARLEELQTQLAALTQEAEEEQQRSTDPTAPPQRDPYAEALVAHNIGDFEGAAALNLEAAETGNTSAMIQLASLYLEGQGVQRDTNEALRWYQAAADVGDAQATFLIGRVYERGTGVARDLPKAVEWYRRAADLGSADAMNNLGVMYSLGEGADKDDAQALQWFAKGAEAGSVNSMFNLAAMYDEGRGAARSPSDAARYMLDALRSGNELVVREMTTNANAWTQEFRQELQRLLKEEGHYQGAIDGSFGPGTRAAITAFAQAGSG